MIKKIYIIKAVTSAVPCDSYHLDIMAKLDKVSPLLDCSHKYFGLRTLYTKIYKFLDFFNWLKTIMALDVDKAYKLM